MSKHIGRVHSSERNPESPGVVVDISEVGVEVMTEDAPHMLKVWLQPVDARTLAALLMHAASEVELQRVRADRRGDFGKG
jgi:hypothetical protein